METPIEDPSGWRYDVQREHVRNDGVLYSLLAAPPEKPVGYLSGFKLSDRLYPFDGNHDGTRRGVMAVIRAHRAYIAAQAADAAERAP